MGYEGHVMLLADAGQRPGRDRGLHGRCSPAPHADVGGDVVSAGGTGTYDLNTVATEIQAGSYALMDTAYAQARAAVPAGAVRAGAR